MNESKCLAVLFLFFHQYTSLILIFWILQDYQPNTELDIKTKQKTNLSFSPASLRLTALTALQIFHSKRFNLSLALFDFPMRKSHPFSFFHQNIVKLTSPSFCALKVSRLFLPFEHSVQFAICMCVHTCVCVCTDVFLYAMLFPEG